MSLDVLIVIPRRDREVNVKIVTPKEPLWGGHFDVVINDRDEVELGSWEQKKQYEMWLDAAITRVKPHGRWIVLGSP